METKDSKITPKSQKKAELKQRLRNEINLIQVSSGEKEAKTPNNPTARKKTDSSTLKREKISQLFNERYLDKLRFQQISSESTLNYKIPFTNEKHASSDKSSKLIKPVPLRPKKSHQSNVLKDTYTFANKRNSIDLANIGLNYLSEDSNNQDNQSYVFANRTNRNSRFVDTRSMHRLSMSKETASMHNLNDEQISSGLISNCFKISWPSHKMNDQRMLKNTSF